MAIVFVHEKIACVFLPSWSQRPGPVLHAGRDLWDNVGWGIFILRMHTLSPLSPLWYSSLFQTSFQIQKNKPLIFIHVTMNLHCGKEEFLRVRFEALHYS